MKKKAGLTGITLGIVFVVIGFAYSNSGVWMMGLIFLALGLLFDVKE